MVATFILAHDAAIALVIAGVIIAFLGWLCAADLRERHCASCFREWAIFPVRGRRGRWVFVCRTCWRSHRRRRLAAR